MIKYALLDNNLLLDLNNVMSEAIDNHLYIKRNEEDKWQLVVGLKKIITDSKELVDTWNKLITVNNS